MLLQQTLAFLLDDLGGGGWVWMWWNVSDLAAHLLDLRLVLVLLTLALLLKLVPAPPL